MLNKLNIAILLSLASISFGAASEEYYVYHLIDPRTNQVFYVGKGVGDRVARHERDAMHPKLSYSSKEQRIRDIWSEGGTVKRKLVRKFDCESEALNFERKEIERIGRHRLTNVRRGTKPTKGC